MTGEHRRSGTSPRAALPRLHVVTDDAVLARADFVPAAREVLEAGGGDLALHVRGPHAPGALMYDRVRRLLAIAGGCGAMLAVNDRLDVALALGVRSVHLGGRSLPLRDARRLVGPETVLGRSVHGVAEAAEASANGADFLFVGNVYGTRSHPGRSGMGLARVEAAVQAADGTPVLAIGGITVERVGELENTGVHGVAVLTGVWDVGKPAAAVRDYISALGR